MAKVEQDIKVVTRNPDSGVSVWDVRVSEEKARSAPDIDPKIAELTKHHRMHNHVFNEIVLNPSADIFNFLLRLKNLSMSHRHPPNNK